jgi:RNA polymerase subunit RPABC4/transcription elongation factor Spt4
VSAASATVDGPFAVRRRRAEALRARHPFAEELLVLYVALLDAWASVSEGPRDPRDAAPWAADHVLPAVVEATLAAGPPALREAVRDRPDPPLAGWLTGAPLDPVDRYLARAALTPVLETLGERAGEACERGVGGEVCPRCGGPPQVSYVAASGESLVSGPRSLLCARCQSSWTSSRSVCPACGENREARLSVHAEHWHGPVSGRRDGNGQPVFGHLRVAACSTCSRYLIEVDMAREPFAVPEVDELAALPLDLYATDQGLTKVTPNLMGF